VLVIAFVGALVGGLLQPIAIGRHSNALVAGLMGAICAAIAVPLLGVVLMLIDHPPNLISIDSLLSFARRIVRNLPRTEIEMWLMVTPVGAIGGIALQWVWLCIEDTRLCGPSRMPPANRSGPLPREGE
jgi:hypothetical protein